MEDKLSDKKLHLKITTHEKIVFDGEVDAVYSRSTQGSSTILHLDKLNTFIDAPLPANATAIVKAMEQ